MIKNKYQERKLKRRGKDGGTIEGTRLSSSRSSSEMSIFPIDLSCDVSN